jgi:hypothetical protein
MKTSLKIEQFRAVLLLFGAIVMLTAGCKQATGSLDIAEEEPGIQDLNINVKYAESYDQTVTTYSRLWPEGISAGFGKGKLNEGGELLVDYERTREVLAFDEDGYMSSVSEFLEGDGEMNMPEETYNELKATMPARSNDYDPVVKTVMEGGSLDYYSESGELVFSYPVDKEEYWIDPAVFDSLKAHETETSQSVKNNLQKLTDEGIQFERIGEFYAGYSMEASAELKADGISKEKYVRDLRNGNILVYATLNPSGEYISVTRSSFSFHQGLPVLSSEERLQFGIINNSWGIIGRTKMTRQNIKVILNDEVQQ